MPYTSQGYMTAADIEEWRRDTDWYELHPRIPEEDECEHCRQWTDDCDDCGRPADLWPGTDLDPVIAVPMEGGGTHSVFRFDNDYGASVTPDPADARLWELAVIAWDGDSYEVTTATPITRDVKRWLGESDVAGLLQKIQALPAGDTR